jgi:predicted dehydrogenase
VGLDRAQRHGARAPPRGAACCEGGTAWLAGGYDEHVTVERGHPGAPPAPEPRAAAGELPLLAELRAFVGYLAGGPPPLSSAEDGVAIVRRIAELRALAGLP